MTSNQVARVIEADRLGDIKLPLGDYNAAKLISALNERDSRQPAAAHYCETHAAYDGQSFLERTLTIQLLLADPNWANPSYISATDPIFDDMDAVMA